MTDHAALAAAGVVGRRPAVLLVDDNPANLLALKALLDLADVELTTASSGTEALAHLLARDFAVVLMDVQMPELDGFMTTELIRKRDRTRETPIIFVTAIFTDRESATRAYSLGALDYLTKPLDETALRAKVAALVASYRRSDTIARQAEALRQKQLEADRAHAARQAAEDASRAKDEFLAMMSHELRTPLNAILGWAALLEQEQQLEPRLSRVAQTIARNARVQSRIIDDLLDLSAIAANQLKISTGVNDLRSVAQSAIATLQPLAMQRSIRLDFNFDAQNHVTICDAIRIEQVLLNIISNAIKFSRDGEGVQIDLERRDQLQLTVKDSGVGIAGDLLPFVFDRFRQGDGSRTRQYGGMGIGLALARGLVEQHGGTLEAFSAGPDKGATFVVRLPTRHEEVAAALQAPATRQAHASVPHAERLSASAPQTDGDPLRGLRVLLVDDEEDARELLAAVLVSAGADVTAAASAGDALTVFAATPFDVLISDLGMPREDGLSLIRRARAFESHSGRGAAIAIAVSGYGSVDDREQAAAAGFQAHMTKPFEPAALIALIKDLKSAIG